MKATMILINTLGIPVHRLINLSKYEFEGDKLVVWYKEKGKRTLVAYAIECCAIAEGWQKITIPPSFVCFDDDLFSKMKNQMNNIIASTH
jgi:hypothetical protein